MNDKDKYKLSKFLFEDVQLSDYIINVIFPKLKLLIPERCVFRHDNNRSKNRIKNLEACRRTIVDFLQNNKKDYSLLTKCYGENVISLLLIGYCFYISETSFKYYNIDIFKDERSVCFSDLSLLDFIE